jgi:hypothetical protein
MPDSSLYGARFLTTVKIAMSTRDILSKKSGTVGHRNVLALMARQYVNATKTAAKGKKMTNIAFQCIASFTLPCSRAASARVPPQPGQYRCNQKKMGQRG